ncbi:MAG: hypothetical protein ABIE70_07800 [bacterium]
MKTVRRIVTVVTLAFVLTAFLAPSQAAYADTTTKQNSLKAGAWALQFQVNPNFTLGAYKGTILSFKKHTSDARAWRVGVSADFDFSDRDMERRNNDESFTSPLYSTEHYSFDLAAQRLWYASPSETVSFFYGLGMRGGYGLAENRRQDPGYPENGNYRKDTSSRWSLGGSGAVGFEWFVKPRISLVGEYEAAILYRSSVQKEYYDHRHPDVENNREIESKTTMTGFSFEHNDVRLGLSVYF